MRHESVTVVVPTYNEAENISGIAEAVLALGYRVLVVDDNSPDGTGNIAARVAESNQRMDVLHRTSKQGLGPAYVAGFSKALAGGAELIAQMDADFSHNPDDLPRLVAAVVGGAQLAIGSRYVEGGGAPDWSWLRRFISKGGNVYARSTLALPIFDATGGFRVFAADALQRLDFATTHSSGYAFQVEMAWRAHIAGLDVVEIPIVFRDRLRGRSKMGWPIVAEAMGLVTRWGFGRIRGKLPWRPDGGDRSPGHH